MPSPYQLEKTGAFVIRNYNTVRPWSSFFPGIAGLFGIPLWVFYVNRGQCVASFGIRSKDEAITEFLPANKAYQLTPSQGFRTFLKIQNKKGPVFYEPFSLTSGILDPKISHEMAIRPFDLTLTEENPGLGLKITVNYFSLANAPFAGLVRELTVENTSRKTMNIELLDGLSVIIPYGVNNWFLKEMSRTIEAWMGADLRAGGVAAFKLSTDPRDTSQVAFVKGAHFYASFGPGKTREASRTIVDPQAVFGEVSDFSYPAAFAGTTTYAYPARQVVKNKTPCAFTLRKASLAPGRALRLFSVIGHVFDLADIEKFGISRLSEDFVEKKKKENEALIESIMGRIFTASRSLEFDLYARQTYLDNVLRGGLSYSVALNGIKKSVYVFSRKHGDLERDYNRFSLSPTYFSEGEGNYRDVNQNRRSDLFFDTSLGDKNIHDFLNLIQLDGYNPLIFKGERFVVSPTDFESSGLNRLFCAKDAKKVAHILTKPFTVGEVLAYMQENNIALSSSMEDFVKKLLLASCGSVEASFGEGYWSDHWTYNTDLLESFLSIYPDQFKRLLFEKNDFTFYDTPVYIKPRSERYCVQRGDVRQYHAIGTDEAKNALIQKRHAWKHKVRSLQGEGDVYMTTLCDKLVCLVVNKLATLDPYGVGIEMEADKPNWYDALNGLPGLFGSSVSETFELKRLIAFLRFSFAQCVLPDSFEVALTSEVFCFLKELEILLKSALSDFDYWDRANITKESYRAKVRRGVSGDLKSITCGDLKNFFDLALEKLDRAIAKSHDARSGSYSTYFSYRVNRYDTRVDASGRHVIMPKEFTQHRLPLFLEGFVHALRTEKKKAADIYRCVKKGPLWDKELKMYKVNATLADESFEIGRAKAFTPGWLENESIWLHMEYKYLLELLKNGLYQEFYDDLSTTLVCFQKPEVYGRSTLENSSFIVSGIHPDLSLHGRGFVARLSGSTAEFLHMWLLMNVGPRPFSVSSDAKLSLCFKPALAASLFTTHACSRSYVSASGRTRNVRLPAASYAFLFLGHTLVVYKNPKKKDTFGKNGVSAQKITLFKAVDVIAQVKGDRLDAPYAAMVRSGSVERIEIELG